MLVIIGSGLAGYMLAKEWRKLDSQTPLTIITADDGAFYSKPLLSTALGQNKTSEQLMVSDAKRMSEELNAQIHTYSRVTEIDAVAHTLNFTQGCLQFSKLVLALGAENILPKLSGNAVNQLKTVNSLCDYHDFRRGLVGKKQLAIIGSGLVGCEFANDLQRGGYQVSVISPDDYPLKSLLPREIGRLLQEKLSQTGVNWCLGDRPQSIQDQEGELALILESGQQITAEGVLSAAGLRPMTDLARRSGIIVNRGIVVNRWLQTNFTDIFALGDCAEVDGLVQMYVAPLLQSTRALAKILTGGRDIVHYPVMPIVLKISVLPLVFVPPPANILGDWRFEGEGDHMRALFHDDSGQLRGFVLSGEKIRDKLPLAKQLPVILSE